MSLSHTDARRAYSTVRVGNVLTLFCYSLGPKHTGNEHTETAEHEGERRRKTNWKRNHLLIKMVLNECWVSSTRSNEIARVFLLTCQRNEERLWEFFKPFYAFRIRFRLFIDVGKSEWNIFWSIRPMGKLLRLQHCRFAIARAPLDFGSVTVWPKGPLFSLICRDKFGSQSMIQSLDFQICRVLSFDSFRFQTNLRRTVRCRLRDVQNARKAGD